MLSEADDEMVRLAHASVREYFDERYGAVERYWWRERDRYSTDADDHPTSLLTQMALRLIDGLPAGRALDLGAGEGADSIRLALLGYEVTAVEISPVAAEKILKFAQEAGVQIDVAVADITEYVPNGEFDLVICNGVLHYIEHKVPVILRMQHATRPGGLNVVSLWSNFTRVPDCHQVIRAFCDDEQGIVTSMYQPWRKELLYLERDKSDMAHDEEEKHSHSHIKMIARKPYQT